MDEVNDNLIQQEVQSKDTFNTASIDLNDVFNQTDYKPVLDIQAQILEQQDKNISFLFNEVNKLKKKTTILIVVYSIIFLLMVLKLWAK